MDQAKPISARISASTMDALSQTREALPLLPAAARKPAILKHWLLRLQLPQIVLILSLVLLPGIVPGMIDTIVEKVSPPTTTEQLGRLFKKRSDLDAHQVTTRRIVWTGGSLLVLILLLSSLPRNLKDAERKADDMESQADAMSDADPAQSQVLYQSAHGLTINPEMEHRLTEKIHKLGNSATASNGTVILEPGQEAEDPVQLVASRYQIKDLLGRGAMGAVFRCHDKVLDRELALKQLAPQLLSEDRFITRFRTEARALAKLSHANIVQVYDFIEEDNHAWIAMERVKGQELEQIITPGHALDLNHTLQLARQMSQAMAYAHEQGVIHRDFKPANILVTEEGQVKIMDFGLARIAQASTQTQIGTVMGTPAFMSPEQANGKQAGTESDIYALGVVLYMMTTGKPPFTGDAQSILAQHLTQKPQAPRTINKNVPAKLNKLILAMLAKEPGDRPKSMTEVSTSLNSIKA